MEPNFFNGNTLLFSRFESPISDYDFFVDKDIKPTEVVIIQKNGKQYIKRVIGLPGETIAIKNNSVYIDEKRLNETYLATTVRTKQAPPSMTIFKNKDDLIIPEGYYFVMGDNRDTSDDSRNKDFGLVLKSEIQGTAIAKIWPLNHFGFIKEYTRSFYE